MRSFTVPFRSRWFLTVFVGLLSVGGSFTLSAQNAPLTFVSTAWPPFTNAPGSPRLALDLVEEALGRIGFAPKTTIVSAGQFTSALLDGRYDGSAAAWKDPEREKVLVFSQPYLENRLVLVGRRGADVSAKSLKDLKGRKIAIVEGYSYGDAVDQSGAMFVRSRSEEDSLAQLLKATVDYTLMDDLVIDYIVSNYPKESSARLQIGSTPLVTRALYLAIRRSRPDADAIISRFNAQLGGMIADRTYHRLLHVDWIQADVKGDGVPVYVPRDDKTGPTEPKRAYALFTNPTGSTGLTAATPETPSGPKPSFYIGGNIYADWASVPESYKEVNSQTPDPRRSQASLFKFSW
jgi:polar amino acid transport system substrate-binding protein